MVTLPIFPIAGTRLISAFRGDYNTITEAQIEQFIDTVEPSPTFAGMLWVDMSQSPKLVKQRNTTNTAWINRWRVDEEWGGLLSLLGTLGGSPMQGAIAPQGAPRRSRP